ncbi:60S ribosomal protein L28 [Plasmodium gonderi]|uniref:60S ribosomal protein L28 n=1 Tax=Plasmodium gonderi TaxID=77519 RepID=A0A1Y1JJ17_PLAGO|nr:60S ribosomal protein L28 [Plasmodium gonderi]GAW81187.1 60S ribosomal protein L28 [Plasmodium gonderi]
MSNVSSALIWELTKKNNCFLKKNKSGKKGNFLCDTYNISCKNTPSSSGLVKENGVNLRFKKGKVVLCVKSTDQNIITNKEYRTKNKEKAMKLIEDHANLVNDKSKNRLIKKYKRIAKLYNCNNKGNK